MATVQHPRLRDAPLDFKGGGAGSFCKKKKLDPLKGKKKKIDPHIEGKKKLDPHGKEKKNLSCSSEKKNLPTHRRRGKSTHLGPQLFRGEGEVTERRVSFWSVTMTFPSKVQPAGGCFELQTLYGACRVFVKIIKISGYISENLMFYTKWRFEQHPHTHPCAHTQIQVWLLAFWCSCQICVI